MSLLGFKVWDGYGKLDDPNEKFIARGRTPVGELLERRHKTGRIDASGARERGERLNRARVLPVAVAYPKLDPSYPVKIKSVVETAPLKRDFRAMGQPTRLLDE